MPLLSTLRTAVRVQAGSGRRAASTGPVKSAVTSTLLVVGGVAAIAYYYDSRSLVHERVAMPLVRLLDAEQGHKLAVKLLANKWLRPKDRGVDGEELQAELFGMPLNNPVGVAAGFDKDADCIDGLFDLGFGYVEVGSVTPEPQPGNPKPRFFRLTEDEAAINRYGFNSLGHAYTLARLRLRWLDYYKSHPPYSSSPPVGIPRSLRPGHILAVNLGKNKTSAADSNEDYIRGVRLLGPYADVVVINVSSPNTPGLRALQGREQLQRLLKDVVEERDRIQVDGLPKIAVKVAADLSEDELADVASAVRGSGVEGVIVSNTTIRREGLGLQSEHAGQVGGLSGKPLYPFALQALKTLRPLLPPSIPIIGCGGISSGTDALEMAQAGASIVQVYTHFGYRGVGTARLLKDEISGVMKGPWRGNVKKDGWDEKRVASEGDALKAEAQGLGDMLRKQWEEDDLARLVGEAEAAIGGETDAQAAGSRDNLAGAAEMGQLEGQIVQAIEALAQERREGQTAALSRAVEPSATEPPAATETTPMLIEPVGGPLGPVVVPIVDQPNVGADLSAREDWREEVRTSQRRLV